MSAQHSASGGPPSAVNGASDVPGEGSHQPIDGAASGGASLPLATADLADLLANGRWGNDANDPGTSGADAHAYDGHVALALDTGILPDIDSTLDVLTSSHQLFDVPALDVSSGPDDAASA